MTDEEKIQRFIQYARCSRECAIGWLEGNQWDIEKTLDIYWRLVILPIDDIN